MVSKDSSGTVVGELGARRADPRLGAVASGSRPEQANCRRFAMLPWPGAYAPLCGMAQLLPTVSLVYLLLFR